MKGSIEQRFWGKVKKTNSCWNWIGNQSKDGYGQFGISDKIKKSAHRFSFELLKGKIPQDLTIDHLCRNRLCVNPDHMKPVTTQENTRRGETGIVNRSKTHCPKGHEFTPANTYYRKDRLGRECLKCRRKIALEAYYR